MRLGPESPEKCHVAAGLSGRMESSWRRSIDTAISIATALKILVRNILDWSVSLDSTGDAVGCRTGVRIRVRLVELVRSSSNCAVGDIAVASYQLNQRSTGNGRKNGAGRLHFVLECYISSPKVKNECLLYCENDTTVAVMAVEPNERVDDPASNMIVNQDLERKRMNRMKILERNVRNCQGKFQ